MLKALSTVALSAALVGCVDARKSYDDFESRIVDGNTSQPDRPNLTNIPDCTGHFLLAVHAAAGGDSSNPLLFVADYTLTANADGTANLSYSASALTEMSPHVVSAGPPPGPQFGSNDMKVALDGTFTAPLQGTLPGDANPISPGTIVSTSNGEKHGLIVSTDLICGTLTGTAGPLPLDGSTFAAIRIAPGTIGDALPTPVTACPM